MASLLATAYTMRAPVPEDVPAALDFFAACDLADYGETTHHEPQEVQRWWQKEETHLVFTTDGRLVGLVALYDNEQQHVRLHGEMHVHPDLRGQGLEAELTDFIEERAREIMQQAPAEAEISLMLGFPSGNQMRRDLLAERGYGPERAFWRMRIDMTAPPPAPAWPEGMTLRTYQLGSDDHAVYEAVEEAFEDHWNWTRTPFEEWMERTQEPSFDPMLWFVAWNGNEIAGVTLCTKEPDKGWINKVAVRRPWRKRGVAMALLLHAFDAFRQRGITRVELGVDAQSLTNAQALYQRAGMRAAMEWAIYAKTLRPGAA